MYFHANRRHQFPLPTRPFSHWNYITMRGHGVYIGDTLTLMNPVVQWWGEGDAKIRGGGNNSFFEHPFHPQVRVGSANRPHRPNAAKWSASRASGPIHRLLLIPPLASVPPSHEAVVHYSITGFFAVRQGNWKPRTLTVAVA
jgi:hypothetical protein